MTALVDVLAVMPGWRIQRNADGSIGVFAPEPKPGESRRTSAAIYPESRGDLSELMFKFFDALLKDEARAAVAELYAERDRLANIVRDHEAQIRRMTADAGAAAELAKAGRLLQRAFAFDPGIEERRELWAEMGQPPETLPTIAYIRRAATSRFATALSKFQEGA